MANIKFSQFTVETAKADVDFLVGYSGPDNVQISPTNLLADYPTGSGTAGQVTFFSAASTVTGDNDFYWDNTNKRLGVGTTSPDRKFEVASTGTGEMCITGATGSRLYFRPTTSYSPGGHFGILVTGSAGPSYLSTMTITGYNNGLNTVMTLKGDGNVGIGTATPVAKLQVEGSFISSGISQLGTTGANVYLTSSSSGNVGIGTSSPNNKLVVNGTVHLGSNGSDVTIGASNSSVIFMLRSGYNYIQASDASGALMFRTGGNNNRMIIDSSGNVGIGTTSPDSLLEISSGTTTDFLKLTSTGSNASPSKIIFEKSATEQGIVEYVRNGDLRIYNTDSDGGVLIDGSSASGNDLYVKNDGNVGIGTTSPGTNLDIQGTSAQSLRVKSDDSATIIIDSDGDNTGTKGSYLHYRDTGATKWTLYKETNNDFYLHNIVASTYPIHAKAGGDIVLMEDGNNLGVGVSSPSYKLDVAGEIKSDGYRIDLSATTQRAITSTGTDSIQFGDSGVNEFKFKNTAGTSMIINSSGNVGVGTITPASKLEVDGGDIEVDDSASGLILRSPDGTRYRVTVANGGTLSVSAV